MSSSLGKIPVLMYHALEDASNPAGSKNPGEQLYVLSRDAFYGQMEYLHNNGFTVLLLDELLQLDEWPERGVVLTFDDGHQSNYTIALPILEKFGFKAHFFITTGWLNTPYFLTLEQVQKLADKGMPIGSHGVTHSFFSDMDAKQVQAELQSSKETLEQAKPVIVKSFSAPGGRIQSSVYEIGENVGYRQYFTSEFCLYKKKSIPTIIPRLAIKGKMDFITFCKIVNGDRYYFIFQQNKIFVLNIFKKILGNPLYEKVRNIVFS